MNFGNYDIFDTVDEKKAKVVLEQMRNNLAEDLLYWKTQSPSEMAKLMENQISAIDIGIKALEQSQINNDIGAKTNADKIRSMSDEDLADWLTNMCSFVSKDDDEPYMSIYNLETECEEEIHDSYGDLLIWLQTEANQKAKN